MAHLETGRNFILKGAQGVRACTKEEPKSTSHWTETLELLMKIYGWQEGKASKKPELGCKDILLKSWVLL